MQYINDINKITTDRNKEKRVKSDSADRSYIEPVIAEKAGKIKSIEHLDNGERLIIVEDDVSGRFRMYTIEKSLTINEEITVQAEIRADDTLAHTRIEDSHIRILLGKLKLQKNLSDQNLTSPVKKILLAMQIYDISMLILLEIYLDRYNKTPDTDTIDLPNIIETPHQRHTECFTASAMVTLAVYLFELTIIAFLTVIDACYNDFAFRATGEIAQATSDHLEKDFKSEDINSAVLKIIAHKYNVKKEDFDRRAQKYLAKENKYFAELSLLSSDSITTDSLLVSFYNEERNVRKSAYDEHGEYGESERITPSNI